MNQKARNDAKNALLNILAFPGLGSLRAGRWVAGLGQILLVAAGSAMLVVWFIKVVTEYYGLMFEDSKPEPVAWLGEIGGVLFGISWLWSCVTSIELFRSASKPDVAPPRLAATAAPKPVEARFQNELATLPDWKCAGQWITRTYEFKDFSEAMKFVNSVAALAEEAQHHPEMGVRWNEVTLALTTHDAGGLTAKDFALARQCDARARE